MNSATVMISSTAHQLIGDLCYKPTIPNCCGSQLIYLGQFGQRSFQQLRSVIDSCCSCCCLSFPYIIACNNCCSTALVWHDSAATGLCSQLCSQRSEVYESWSSNTGAWPPKVASSCPWGHGADSRVDFGRRAAAQWTPGAHCAVGWQQRLGCGPGSGWDMLRLYHQKTVILVENRLIYGIYHDSAGVDVETAHSV